MYVSVTLPHGGHSSPPAYLDALLRRTLAPEPFDDGGQPLPIARQGEAELYRKFFLDHADILGDGIRGEELACALGLAESQKLDEEDEAPFIVQQRAQLAACRRYFEKLGPRATDLPFKTFQMAHGGREFGHRRGGEPLAEVPPRPAAELASEGVSVVVGARAGFF